MVSTYMAEPIGERKAVVASKGECLPRGRGHGTDGDHNDQQEDDNGHARGAADRARGVLEDVYEGKSRRRGKGLAYVADAEEVCKQKAKGKGHVE
jgi:hypothetical protein